MGLLFKIVFGIYVLENIATCKKDKATPATVTDIDGNVYHTVKIGTQTWMLENLRTTHYNDNTPIENITDNTAWKNSDGPAYSWYNNDITNKTAYGALYNWEAIYTGKLAPKGWHVPSVADWEQLINFIGGSTSTAHKLKEVGRDKTNDRILLKSLIYKIVI